MVIRWVGIRVHGGKWGCAAYCLFWSDLRLASGWWFVRALKPKLGVSGTLAVDSLCGQIAHCSIDT